MIDVSHLPWVTDLRRNLGRAQLLSAAEIARARNVGERTQRGHKILVFCGLTGFYMAAKFLYCHLEFESPRVYHIFNNLKKINLGAMKTAHQNHPFIQNVLHIKRASSGLVMQVALRHIPCLVLTSFSLRRYD
jgi:hypothetical protein